MTQEQKERLDLIFRWLIDASAPVAAAAMIGVGTMLWNMQAQIQEMDATQRLWQERVGSQLDQISRRLDGTYSQSDGMRMESQIEEIGDQVEDHEARIKRLERRSDK